MVSWENIFIAECERSQWYEEIVSKKFAKCNPCALAWSAFRKVVLTQQSYNPAIIGNILLEEFVLDQNRESDDYLNCIE